MAWIGARDAAEDEGVDFREEGSRGGGYGAVDREGGRGFLGRFGGCVCWNSCPRQGTGDGGTDVLGVDVSSFAERILVRGAERSTREDDGCGSHFFGSQANLVKVAYAAEKEV